MPSSTPFPFKLLSLLLLLLLSPTPSLSLRPSSGCGKTPQLITSQSTQVPLRITVRSKNRQYFARLPPSYNNTVPHRLVLTLHALQGTASQVIAGTNGYLPYYGLPPLVPGSDGPPAVFVVPDGLNNGWANQSGEDVDFVRAVLAAVEADLCVDQDLRFSTGFSYGGAMSYALACALGGGEMRAVAALSGNPMISGCAPGSAAAGAAAAVAYYGQHGVSDTVLPISGGREMRDRFLRVNGCAVGSGGSAGEPRAGSGSSHVKTEYEGCMPDKPVVWVAFDGPHTPTPRDQGQADTFTARETWQFFARFK